MKDWEMVKMDINKVANTSSLQLYSTQASKNPASKDVASKDPSVPTHQQDKVEISSEALAALSNTKEKEVDINTKNSPITKMSETERGELVKQLKAEQEQRTQKLIDFVRNSISSQGNNLSNIDDVWKFIASGEYTVDAQTKEEAIQSISEDGYYGVKETSERIFQFALALTGGDEESMKKMQAAVEEGFSQATEAWGRELPSITSDTHDVIKQKFNDYYTSLKENKEKV